MQVDENIKNVISDEQTDMEYLPHRKIRIAT
jgi:hypothetical protein